MAAYERLLREMKASPAKAAVLGVLLVIGIYYWIPPIWNLAMGSEAGVAVVPVNQNVPYGTPSVPEKTETEASLHWDDLERRRLEDVLYRPATISEVNQKAFSFSNDVLPLDVEFAVDTPATQTAGAVRDRTASGAFPEQKSGASLAQRLELRSTMIGTKGRAAVINNRVYQEGDELLVDGTRVRLTKVTSRRVTFDANGQSFELQIDPFALNTLQSHQ